MKSNSIATVAALPPHSAERLRLSGPHHHQFHREATPRFRRTAFCLLPTVFCLLLSAFCLLPSAYAATWTRQSSKTMAWLHAVYFLDQNRGWVAGSGGTLLET